MTCIYETCTDRRNNSKFFFPSKLFFTFLPLGDASVCSEKMAALGEKSFCVLEYHTSKSAVTVRRVFRAKYTWAFVPSLPRDLADLRHGSLQRWRISMHTCWRTRGKNLNIVSTCAVSPMVHTLNIFSCQKKKKKTFSVFLWLWTVPLR